MQIQIHANSSSENLIFAKGNNWIESVKRDKSHTWSV